MSVYEGRPEGLTQGMRALTVLFAFVGGVENGGFASCMYNSTGDLTGEAISAAKLVGAHEHAAVFARFAETALGGDLDMDVDTRNQRLEAMNDQEEVALQALDDGFFELPPIDAILTDYVDLHPAEFFRD